MDIEYKNPAETQERLEQINRLVLAEFLDGKPLTVQGIIGMLLESPDICDPTSLSQPTCAVTFILSDIKVLSEEIPAGNWPLYVTKATFGPITVHCRPERTSELGALIKLRPQNFMFKGEDNFLALREAAMKVNAKLTSLAKKHEREQADKNALEQSTSASPQVLALAS